MSPPRHSLFQLPTDRTCSLATSITIGPSSDASSSAGQFLQRCIDDDVVREPSTYIVITHSVDMLYMHAFEVSKPPPSLVIKALN